MGLPGRQQRALDDIESALEARYPHLVAMFAIFTRLSRGEELTSPERLPRRSAARMRPGVLAVLPIAAVMAFLAGLLIAVAMGGVAACATTARPVPASRYSGCRAPADRPGHFGVVPVMPK
jgi:hypothetical protein